MHLEHRILSVNDLSSIAVSYTRIDQPGWVHSGRHLPPPQILVVAFSGCYRYGSSGYSDALYIRAMIDAGLSAFCPFSFIIDLTNLEYEWGDDIDYGLDAFLDEGPEPPIVVGYKCHDGLKSFIHGINSTKELIDNVTYFATLNDAIAYLKPIAIKC